MIQNKIQTVAYALCFIFIFLCGFYLRYESQKNTNVFSPLRADAGHYFMYAYNLRHNHVYSYQKDGIADKTAKLTPDAIRSPGYPLFLTFFAKSIPNLKTVDHILFCQMIISIITLLISWLFFQNFLSKAWTVAASLMVAISPHIISANNYVLTETLFCFNLSLIGYALSHFAKKPSQWLAGITGFLLGSANLIRPSIQYLPIFISFFFLFQYGRKKGGRFVFFMILGFMFLTLPWLTRNMITLGVVTDKTLSNNFLHQGMYPDFEFRNSQESFGFPHKFDPNAMESGKNTKTIFKEIIRRFHTEPLRHLKWYIINKPIAYWSWNTVQSSGDVFLYPTRRSPYYYNSIFKATHRLMYAIHWPVVLLCYMGSLLIWFPKIAKKLPEHKIIAARYISIILLYYTVIHMIGFPLPRYSIPLRPFLFGMAMFSFSLLFINVTDKKLQ